MAGGIIKDGTGEGFSAKVDNFNRLRTFATSTTQEHHGTGIGVNFMFSTQAQARTLTLKNADDGPMLYIQNTNPNALLVITQITVGTSAGGVIATIVKNNVIGTVGANVSGSPKPPNLRFDSGVVAQATMHVWDETGTTGITGLSGGADLETNPLALGRTPENIDGGIDLGAGNSLTISLSNNTGGAAEVSVAVRAFFESTSV